jgi:hypothetical protein
MKKKMESFRHGFRLNSPPSFKNLHFISRYFLIADWENTIIKEEQEATTHYVFLNV